MRRLLTLSDKRLMLLLAVLSLFAGGNYLLTLPSVAGFQITPELWSPAVMLASGRGFITPIADVCPPLVDFLAQRTMEFDPTSLPDELPTLPNSHGVRTHCYLLFTGGLFWWLFGIDWHTLHLLTLTLYVAAVLIAFKICRLGMNRVLSFAVTAAFMCSPAVITALISPRDFSKAPFILAIIWVIGRLAARPVSRNGFPGYATLLGLLVGIGQGFRQDVLIALLPAVAALVFLARTEPRTPLLLRIIAPVMTIGVFAVFAWPALTPPEDEGSLLYHNVMMGMAPESSELLGVGCASYELQYYASDNLSHAIRTDYARRIHGNRNPINYQNPEAEKISRQYVMETLKDFPADYLARSYASIKSILCGITDRKVPLAPQSSAFTSRLTALHDPIGRHLEHYGLVYVAMALVAMSCVSIRAALCAFFLIMYFGGYTAIQFQVRHAFHLGLVPLWCLGFVVDRLGTGFSAACRTGPRRACRQLWHERLVSGRVLLRRAIPVAACCAAALYLPLAISRVWQDKNVMNLAAQMSQASLTPVPLGVSNVAGWSVFSPLHRVPLREAGEKRSVLADSVDRQLTNPAAMGAFNPYDLDVRSEWFVAELAPGSDSLPLAILYEAESPSADFSRILFAGPNGENAGGARFFFPVYEFPDSVTVGRSRFYGIAVPEDHAGEVMALWRVENTAEFPVMPLMTLPKNLDQLHAHQTVWPETYGRRYPTPLRIPDAIQSAIR